MIGVRNGFESIGARSRPTTATACLVGGVKSTLSPKTGFFTAESLVAEQSDSLDNALGLRALEEHAESYDVVLALV